MVRVFISHCANHDPRTDVVLMHLCAHLPDDELELVWDRDMLGVGDDWDDKLLTEMERCDGAILLLPEVALKRSYVVKECTILCQRKRHSQKWGGDTFELLSVFIGGVTDATLMDPARSHMKDLNLGKFQAGNDGDLDALLEALRPKLDRLKLACQRGTPRTELLREIGSHIETGIPGADERLAQRLKLEQANRLLGDKSKKVRALTIATELPGKPLHAVVGRALAGCRDDFTHKAAKAIVRRLATFAVPPEAAALIPKVAGDARRARSLEINATNVEVGRWYGCLAYGRMLGEQTAEVTNKDRGLGPDALYNEIERCLVDSVKADDVEEAKEELEFIGTPFFVLVPSSAPESSVVKKVHQSFPSVTLIFLTGEKVVERANSDVLRLEPVLGPQQEEKSLKAYRKTKEKIEEAYANNE